MKTASHKTADIAFDPQSLMAQVQEFAAHAKSRKRLPLVRITEFKIPPAVKPLPHQGIRHPQAQRCRPQTPPTREAAPGNPRQT